jgi:hypothetical protein
MPSNIRVDEHLQQNCPRRPMKCSHCGSGMVWVRHFYGSPDLPRGRYVCIAFGANCKYREAKT